MRNKIISITLFVFCSFSIESFAGNRLNLKVLIPKNVDSKKIMILLENGLELKIISPIFINNQCIITEQVYSQFASVSLGYPAKNGAMLGVTLLVPHTIIASVRFEVVKDTMANQFSKYRLVNCTNPYKCRQYFQIQSYSKVLSDSNNFYSGQYNKIKNDSILALYNLSSKKLAVKQMEFIKNHGNDYYYFWFFRTNVANVLLKTHQIELYETFNTAFPAKFKESEEGKNIKALITGRLFIREGGKAPDFNVVDYKGNIVSSENYKDKYILLNFWATWCGPCIAEIPLLKKIRDTYTADKLEIISVSYDTDSAAFIKGIKRFDLNWTNVYSNTNLQILYGKKPIPSVYLIDTNGIILFSSWQSSTDKLEEMLKKAIIK